MSAAPSLIAGMLMRTALLQLVSLVVVGVLMRQLRFRSPSTCRLACFLVLLQGCLLVPLTVSIPWYDPPPRTAGRDLSTTGPRGVPTGLHSDRRFFAGHDPALTREPGSADANGTGPIAPKLGDLHRVPAPFWRLLVAVWLLGMGFTAARSVLRYARFVWTFPPKLPVEDSWQRQWQGLLARCGVRLRVRLVVTGRLGPMLCLLPRGYAVVVPARFWRDSSRTEREAILRHELAHLRRGDIWKSALAHVLAIPHWYNPAVWWALRAFHECSEWACDRAAVCSPRERLDYVKALTRLASMRFPVAAVGYSAQAHPFVTRVRFLLESPSEEKSVMKRTALITVACAAVLFQLVRVELVAKEPELTRETVTKTVEKFDERLQSLGDRLDGLKEKAETLKDEVEGRLEKLRAMAENPAGFSDEMQRRVVLLGSGDEASQLKAIEGAAKLGDEGVMLLGGAADQTTHQAVRRKALETAIGLGRKGYLVVAHVFDSLSEDDKLFVIEQLSEHGTLDDVIVLLYLCSDAEGKLKEAAIKAGVATSEKVLFVAALANDAPDELIVKLIGLAAEFEDDDGILLLYAAAHGEPNHQIAALKAAAAKGQDGLIAVAPAYKSRDPKVRAEVVCCAKKVGGPLAEWIIDGALNVPDADLRKAAEDALKEEK